MLKISLNVNICYDKNLKHNLILNTSLSLKWNYSFTIDILLFSVVYSEFMVNMFS